MSSSKRSTGFFTLLTVIVFAVFIWISQRQHRFQQAVKDIQKLEGHVSVVPPLPDWVNEFTDSPPLLAFGKTQISLNDVNLSKRDLNNLQTTLKEFSTIEVLALAGHPVDDEWLLHLKDVHNVNILCLEVTDVTDSGLQNLSDWNRLEILSVQGNLAITQKGIISLKKRLPQLESTGDTWVP